MLLSRPLVDGTFGWLYFHCTLPKLQDQQTRSILLTGLYTHSVTLIRLENAIRLITHGITVSLGRHGLTAALLSLLSDVLARARGHLSEKDLRWLKTLVVQYGAIQGLCVSQDLAVEVHEGVWSCASRWFLAMSYFSAIREFVAASFDPTDAEDQALLSSIGSYWVETVTKSLSLGRFDEVSGASSPESDVI
jgi:nucleolar pre-ribosomal-associated protein 1